MLRSIKGRKGKKRVHPEKEEVKKMPKKEKKASEWMDEVQRGLDYRKKYGEEDKWADNEKQFYGYEDAPHCDEGVNIINETGDSLLAALSVPIPHISIKAKRREFLWNWIYPLPGRSICWH